MPVAASNSPTATDSEVTEISAPTQEQHANVTAATTDAVGPLNAEELTRKTALETELADERPTHRLKLRDGHVVEGRIVSQTPFSIRFRDGFGYSGFVVESYKRSDVLAVETLPAASFEVTSRDVRFSAEFPQFHFVKSPPYTVVTDESFGEVQKILVVLADLREQLHQRFAPLIKQEGDLQDIHVVFFGSEEAFRRYALRTAPSFVNSAGFFSSGENRLALLNQLGTTRYTDAQVRLDERSRRLSNFADAGPQLAALRSDITSEAKSMNERLIRHEGAHQLFHAYHVHSRFGLEPTWLTEGLAQYCETPEIGRYHATLADHVTRARKAGQLLPLKMLLNHHDSSGFFALGDGNIELAYAESWALVYMLMQDEYRDRFFDYIKSYRDVEDYRTAHAMEKAVPETLAGSAIENEPQHTRKPMGFLYHPSVIRRIVVYGASVLLLLVVLTLGRGFGQSGPRSRDSLLTFDGLQHALLGDTKKSPERDSAIALRHEIDDGNGDSDHSIHDKPVVYASARDIPAHDDVGRPNYVAGQLIVRFRNGVSHHRQDEIVDELGARILRTLDAHRGEYLVVLSGGVSVPSAAQQFASVQEIDFAEPNILHYINDLPNDSYYTGYDGQSTELQRWYFNGIDATSNLNAEAAWNITTGSTNIVIAVIDTGVAIHHPDLAANIWTNPGDDSSDGYTNDVHGWDFYNNDNDPDSRPWGRRERRRQCLPWHVRGGRGCSRF